MQLRPSTRIFRVATVLKLHVATPQLFDILVLYYSYREPNDTEYYYEQQFQKYLMSNFYLVAVCNISNLYKKILQLFSISFFCFGIYWHFSLIVWYFIPWTIKNKSASILKCKLTHWFSALKIITYKELQYSGV